MKRFIKLSDRMMMQRSYSLNQHNSQILSPQQKGIVSAVGFEKTPGGVEYHNRESLNDHTYCC